VSYRKFEPRLWSLKMNGRGPKGDPRINVYGPTFNLHPVADETGPTEPWSLMPFAIATEREGKPVDKYQFSFRVSREQAAFVEDVGDAWAIDNLTATSTEWNGKPLRRDQVQAMYRSSLRREEGREPLMKMNYTTRGLERYYTVIYYFDAKEDGTWSREHRRGVTGEAGLVALMGEHRFQRAKVRVEARLSGFAVVNKTIYPRWELSKVFVKAPHASDMSEQLAPSVEDVKAMFDVE
jgi:hypothetical protein